MAHSLTNSQRLSLKINRIFDYLSVNEETIRHRRNCYLQIESNHTATLVAEQVISEEVFYFGSQSEGTTTIGLKSDYDCVAIPHKINVKTNASDPIPDDSIYAFKMEGFTKRGFCLLRYLSFEKRENPLVYNRFERSLKPGTSYLKNSFQVLDDWYGTIPEKEGPAIYHQTKTGESINCLCGFACTSWPTEVINTFVMNQSKCQWPSDHLLQDILQSKCFLVPKGSGTGPHADIEWRLSFSCGERLLMFDLNIVHIRCYILMKYIKTQFLDNVLNCKGIVSSYICKTVLFHTLSRALDSHWLEEDLLKYWKKCLTMLYKFIEDENCPHFIMPKNNLLANKLDKTMKIGLLTELQRIINSDGHALFEIQIDEFGELAKHDFTPRKGEYAIYTQRYLFYDIISNYSCLMLQTVCGLSVGCSRYGKLVNMPDEIHDSYCERIRTMLKELLKFYSGNQCSNQRMTDSVRIWLCLYSTIMGSYLASDDIKNNSCLSSESFQWLLLGMQCTDVASAHLKLVSILFMSGDLECTNILLNDICKKMDSRSLIAHCCSCKRMSLLKRQFEEIEDILSKQTFGEIFRENVAYCVVFVPEEIHSCPKELRYEMHRGVFSKMQKGYSCFTSWVNLASIPQLPFLHFMQYKYYQKLGMKTQCHQALIDMMNFDLYIELCLQHLDTVYNLIGQCLEQEGFYNEALQMYRHSLQIEPEYNAAKFHICCNLLTQFEQLKKVGHDF
ncbi:hypothetical protein ACF0H5_011287 [Mactra antiquata]